MVVKDIKDAIKELCPVKVTYKGEVMFDDDAITDLESAKTEMKKYRDFIESDNTVEHLSIDVVHFHHTIIEMT